MRILLAFGALLTPAAALGQLRVPEGGEIFLLAPEAAASWAWDLDGDGAFDDCVDEPECLLSAAGLDGPGEFEIAILEDDVARTIPIAVENVAPTVLSQPPLLARRGGAYRYVPAVVDPAGALDPYTLALVDGNYPGGMAVLPGDAENPPAIVWTPNVADIAASPNQVEMEVEDDDGGLFTQIWDIDVADNSPPFEPSLLYPLGRDCVVVDRPNIQLGNASDLDEDPLTYFIEVDPDPAFRSIGLQASGPLPEGAGGFTQWQVPRPLTDGELYYWRAWVTDTIQESEKIVEVFEVCLAEEPDPGPGNSGNRTPPADSPPLRVPLPDRDPRGCACWPESPRSDGEPAAAGCFLLYWAIGTRRGRAPSKPSSRKRTT